MAEFKKREIASDVPVGRQLRDVRKTAKLSLEEVARQTKIHHKFLEALEEGRYEEFPADVYARGFLENYAAFLGFPSDEILLQYRRERGLAKQTPKLPKIPMTRAKQSPITITPRTLWIAGGIFSLLLASGYLLSQIFGFVAAPPKLEVLTPVANAQVSTESVTVEGTTDAGAELSINGQPVPTDPNGGFREEVRLLSGPNTLRVSAKNKSGKEKVVTRSVVLTGQIAATPTPAPVASGMLLTVKVGPNSAYVGVNVDGKVAFQGLLLPNSEQTFSVQSRALITTSNGGSTRVFINGQDRGALGAEGQRRVGKEFLAPTPAPSPSPVP